MTRSAPGLIFGLGTLLAAGAAGFAPIALNLLWVGQAEAGDNANKAPKPGPMVVMPPGTPLNGKKNDDLSAAKLKRHNNNAGPMAQGGYLPSLSGAALANFHLVFLWLRVVGRPPANQSVRTMSRSAELTNINIDSDWNLSDATRHHFM